jgi:hypothetical protein
VILAKNVVDHYSWKKKNQDNIANIFDIN